MKTLTPEEVAELKDGEEVYVTWSGGNGPHKYIIKRFRGDVFALTDWDVANGRIDSEARLDRIGSKPFTVRVWREFPYGEGNGIYSKPASPAPGAEGGG